MHIVSNLPPFLKGVGAIKIPKNRAGGQLMFKKSSGLKGRREIKLKICRGDGIFSF